QTFVRRKDRDMTSSLTRFHPEIAQPPDHHPAEKGCAELIATVPQLLFTNLTVAACILNTLWLYLCGALHYGELAFDVAEAQMRPVLPITTPAQVIVGDEVTSL